MAAWGASTWLQILQALRSLRGSLLDVFRAELDALGRDLSASAKRLGGALLLLFFAAGVALFAVGALAFAAISALALAMPAWGGGLIVFGALLITAAILASVGVRRLKAIESPGETVKRRVTEHVDWWRFRVQRIASANRPRSPYARPSDPWRDDDSY
jgi:hypothetical protein